MPILTVREAKCAQLCANKKKSICYNKQQRKSRTEKHASLPSVFFSFFKTLNVFVLNLSMQIPRVEFADAMLCLQLTEVLGDGNIVCPPCYTSSNIPERYLFRMQHFCIGRYLQLIYHTTKSMATRLFLYNLHSNIIFKYLIHK